MSTEKFENAIELDATEDFTGLWFVIGLAHSMFPLATEVETMEIVLSSLKNLLQSNRIVACSLAQDNVSFRQWTGTPDEIVAKIRKDWVALGRKPSLGEVVWFSNLQGDT